MKLLFMPYPSASGTWGCTAYMVAIAQAASDQGHEILFHACPPSSKLILDNGFRVQDFRGASGSGGLGVIRDIYDVFTALGLDDADYWSHLLEAEHGVIDNFAPDVVITDMRPTAVISAVRSSIPLVAMASVGTDPRLQARADGHPLDSLARNAAKRYLHQPIDSFPELLFWQADRKLATSFEQFEPELADVPGISYVGYLESTHRSGLGGLPAPPERLVLAYLSTVGWNSERMVRSLAHSAELADVNLWCVTNANGNAGQLGSRLRLFDYLPLGELLPKADGLLFHGGQGTALAALFHGVPAIAFPGQNYERQYNADRLQALGCGLHASVMDLRPRHLSSLLAHLVNEASLHEAASAAKGLLRALPGRQGAVGVIESLAR